MSHLKRVLTAIAVLAYIMPAVAGEAIEAIHTPQGIGMSAPYWAIPSDKAPGDPTILYLSTDMGATWDVTLPLPTNMIEPPAITGLAYSWDYIYVATDGEGVFRTDNGKYWEKWNDADVSIKYITGSVGKPVAVITEDGATFAKTNSQFHNTFVQQYDIPLTATAVFMDVQTRIGTSDGKVYTFMNADLFDTTDGQGSRPGPLPGAVREILELSDVWAYVVEDSEGRNRVYTKVDYSLVGSFKRLYLDGAPLYVDTVTEAYGGLGVVTTGEQQRLLYTCDNGESWEEIQLPVSSGVNSVAMGGCDSPYPHWRVRLATDEGGFVSTDQGVSWTAFGDIGSEETGSLRTAHSDIGVRMVSPSANTATISNSTTRFELEVTNHGDERVEDVKIFLEFMVWYNGGTQGSSSWGTSVKIDGVECERYSISCLIGRLEPGESARVVWLHGLGENAFSMRLAAQVHSDRLNDSNSNNNRLDFSPNVRGASEIGGDSGGGGSIGLWLLLALLYCRSLVNSPAENNRVQSRRIPQQEDRTSVADHASPGLHGRLFPDLRMGKDPQPGV